VSASCPTACFSARRNSQPLRAGAAWVRT
jgi:hypothetical protein